VIGAVPESAADRQCNVRVVKTPINVTTSIASTASSGDVAGAGSSGSAVARHGCSLAPAVSAAAAPLVAFGADSAAAAPC
jgi:hypothetical protein